MKQQRMYLVNQTGNNKTGSTTQTEGYMNYLKHRILLDKHIYSAVLDV